MTSWDGWKARLLSHSPQPGCTYTFPELKFTKRVLQRVLLLAPGKTRSHKGATGLRNISVARRNVTVYHNGRLCI